jgi:hypothetical protein
MIKIKEVDRKGNQTIMSVYKKALVLLFVCFILPKWLLSLSNKLFFLFPLTSPSYCFLFGLHSTPLPFGYYIREVTAALFSILIWHLCYTSDFEPHCICHFDFKRYALIERYALAKVGASTSLESENIRILSLAWIYNQIYNRCNVSLYHFRWRTFEICTLSCHLSWPKSKKSFFFFLLYIK